MSAKAPVQAEMLDNTFWPVAIGAAARLSKVSAKMVRHYEALGLLPLVARTDSGYRQYTEAEVRTLQFIKRARELGFSMAEIAELVGLWHNRKRASASVKRIAQKHVNELTQRIEAMQAMQRTLASLLDHCHGDERPDCPILDDLAGHRCQAA
ncbi:MAG: Cu(I)-responsive transcriptional regulator [Rhodoferax sp.]|uniref:Cu(I)-responsive transcriptional regulator n=1 Tax=Rhodoferax sp. TaxID=50421 RepID=UPI002608A5CA|nr:Cu(I)-responsive transcriptional regulator [Rhodoferax sp.]MDD5336270.1 Cu(I)-responsive transcriptional regulator [Rhodoferax sp.]